MIFRLILAIGDFSANFSNFLPIHHGRKESRPQKTGPGSQRFLRILWNLWGSAGSFCRTFHIVKNMLKKGSAEPQRFCRTLGVKPQLFKPCNLQAASSSPTSRDLNVWPVQWFASITLGSILESNPIARGTLGSTFGDIFVLDFLAGSLRRGPCICPDQGRTSIVRL